MSPRRARTIAMGVIVATVASVAASTVIWLAIGDRVPRGEIVVVGDLSTPGMREIVAELEERVADGEALIEGAGEINIGFAVITVALMLWIGVGALIVWRQPANWAGWLFIITGAPLPLLSLGQVLVVYGLKVESGAIPLVGALATIGEFSLFPIALLPLLFLLYPDGHLPSPRWRWAVIGLLGGTAAAVLGFVVRPGPFNNWIEDGIVYENPVGIDAFGLGPIVITAGTIAALVAALSSAVAVRQRFRRSTGEERQQMRLLAFVASLAGVFFIVTFVAGFVAEAFFPSTEVGEAPIFPILFGLTAFTLAVGIPAAYLVAIFRYRLWDLDLVIKKAVVFGFVATGITLLGVVVVFIVPVAVLGTGLTGWEWGLLFVGVALGLVVGPLRRRARRLADRIVYRERATPYEVLTAFSERVGETYSTDDVLPRMVQVLASGTGAISARVLLRVGADLREVARWPDRVEPTAEEHTVPVVHLGEALGVLAVTMPANDPMDPSKQKLVEDLASQAALVLRNVRLIEELRASRQRLVAAQDEERRKIERDLHDGAQQQLVSLTIQLRLAEQMVGRDERKVREILHRLQNASNDALEDLRDLARGIYPPLLADQGLAAALKAQARKSPVPVRVEAGAVGRYPREVESAVYFCTLEALNNVAKYANASSATVRLGQANGSLTFAVTDDGRGFDADATSHGTGLQGMADRLDAIGGALEIESAPGAGTTVAGRVPVGTQT